ncbi:MAG: Uma2 family endonuclease [Cyanobacteria bacterium J06621_3]
MIPPNLPLYQSYEEYLYDERLSPENNYRLLSTGELIEVPLEDDLNVRIAMRLMFKLWEYNDKALFRQIRTHRKEFQVPPVGDQQMSRRPDLMVMHPEHLEVARYSILLGMVPPLFIAEVVSPGDESSDNYQRDYVWKRQQYEWWHVPEYWIIDPHRETVTVLVLVDGTYVERIYKAPELIASEIFPLFSIATQDLLEDDWA